MMKERFVSHTTGDVFDFSGFEEALLLNSERRHACPMCLTLKQYTEFQAYLTL